MKSMTMQSIVKCPPRPIHICLAGVMLTIGLPTLSREFTSPAVAARTCNSPQTQFCDAGMLPPAAWRGVTFRLSQNYPKAVQPDSQPWRQFNPTTQQDLYLRAALQYFFEGHIAQNYEQSFDPLRNPVRTWYHAPWQDFGVNGREFVHGLTRERTSEPGELHPKQKNRWHNYAVGFYNTRGGYTLGQVWQQRGNPDPKKGTFPEGTVAAKLLFTTAPISEVPYLRGAPEWTAYVYAKPNAPKPYPLLGDKRVLMKLRLLQIDISVKESRVNATTGWVFGTFVYGGGLNERQGQGWGNVYPVGMMWGNDPSYSGTGNLQETWINSQVALPHLGLAGRLNGPVDNPASSCLSCHSTAQFPQVPMLPVAGADAKLWFRNIKAGAPFDASGIALDYSLALSTGIDNFNKAKALSAPQFSSTAIQRYNQSKSADPRPPRDGGINH